MGFTMDGIILIVLCSLLSAVRCGDIAPETVPEDPIIEARNDKENPLKVMFEWKQIIYEYPSPADEKADIENGNYIPGNPFPVAVDAYYSSDGVQKVFIVTPQYIAGVPATLSTVTGKKLKGNPVLAPYPSWNWHNDTTQSCSKRIVSAFALRDKLVYQANIPKESYSNISLFSDFIVDIRDKCEDPYLYLSDGGTSAIVVWNVKANRSWRVQDETMYPSADYATISVNGESLKYMLGVIAMALSKDARRLYFPMNAGTEIVVSTSFLRDPALSEPQKCVPGLLEHSERFTTLLVKKPSQCSREDIDKDGVMFFGLIGECTLACYNTNENSRNYDEIVTDKKMLDYIFSVKVINKYNSSAQEVWVTTNRFQKIANCTLNPNEINFRILVGNAEDLTARNGCRPNNIKN